MGRISWIGPLALMLCGCASDLWQANETPPESLPVSSSHYWKGQAYQASGKARLWTVEASIFPGQQSVVAYPSLGCTGVWTYQTSSQTGVMHYQEKIEKDQRGRCVPEITIQVLPASFGKLEYRALYKKSVIASGLLHPVSKNSMSCWSRQQMGEAC